MLRTEFQRRRRRAQAGQTLILALAFIAFFGVTVVAVLRVADIPGQQHAITEQTATNDTGDEAGAAFAAADVGRTDIAPLTCNPPVSGQHQSGQLTMQNSGHTANYQINSCNPGGPPNTGGGGQSCLLCILNQVSPVSPSAVVYTAGNISTSGGNDFINGSIANGSKLAASPAGSHIEVIAGATYSGCTCTPTPVLTYSLPVVDPLASVGAPSPVAGKPTGCTSWDPVLGCSKTISGSTTINPGLWNTINYTGNGTVTMTAGTYVFTGNFNLAGTGTFDGSSGVTVYLACTNYGAAGNACPTSGTRTGGYVTVSGNGTSTFNPPTSGPYTGIVLLADPNLLDPGGTSNCITGVTTACALSIGGNGASFNGTQDLRSSGLVTYGNGGEAVNGGRFIANSLNISGSGNSKAGLHLTGPGGPINTTTCALFDIDASSTGSPATHGRALIQQQCGSKGVVDFNYTP